MPMSRVRRLTASAVTPYTPIPLSSNARMPNTPVSSGRLARLCERCVQLILERRDLKERNVRVDVLHLAPDCPRQRAGVARCPNVQCHRVG